MPAVAGVLEHCTVHPPWRASEATTSARGPGSDSHARGTSPPMKVRLCDRCYTLFTLSQRGLGAGK
eukprot:3591179-Alexandrium_andersonii.AAC.1